MQRNKGLRKLLLSRNPALGDEGVKALCEGLCHSNIRNLQLEEVGMGDEVNGREIARAEVVTEENLDDEVMGEAALVCAFVGARQP